MKQPLITGLSTLVIVYLLIYVGLFIKLATLGDTSFSGTIGPATFPLGHIENSRNGFSLEIMSGSIIIPLLAGVTATLGSYFAGKHHIKSSREH